MDGRTLAALSGQEGILVIRRPLVEWLGGHVADALLLDQGLYWQAQAGPGVWWARSDADMAAHLCMTLHALAQARGRLVGLGLLKAERHGTPARMHYLVDADHVAEALAAHLAQRQTGLTSPADSQNLPGEFAELSIYKGTSTKVLSTPDGVGAGPRRRAVAAKGREAAAAEPDAHKALFKALCEAQRWSTADLTPGNRAQLASLAKRILEEPEADRPTAADLATIAARLRRNLAARFGGRAVTDPTVMQLRQDIGAWIRARQAARATEGARAAAAAQQEARAAEEALAAASPAAIAWEGILGALRGVVPPASFAAWLAPARALDVKGGNLTVSVASEQAADWIGQRVGGRLIEAARALGVGSVTLLPDVGNAAPVSLR